MHSERVNELEWNNRPIKVFIYCLRNVDTKVQTYQLLSRSQARLLFVSASTALLSWTVDNLSSSIVVLKCVFISFRQLKDLLDARNVTGIVQAICRSLLSS